MNNSKKRGFDQFNNKKKQDENLLFANKAQGGKDPENEEYDDDGPQGFSRDIQMTHGDATHEADEMLDEDDREDDKEPSDGEDLDENIDADYREQPELDNYEG